MDLWQIAFDIRYLSIYIGLPEVYLMGRPGGHMGLGAMVDTLQAATTLPPDLPLPSLWGPPEGEAGCTRIPQGL